MRENVIRLLESTALFIIAGCLYDDKKSFWFYMGAVTIGMQFILKVVNMIKNRSKY